MQLFRVLKGHKQVVAGVEGEYSLLGIRLLVNPSLR
jgi:hypothetical protein